MRIRIDKWVSGLCRMIYLHNTVLFCAIGTIILILTLISLKIDVQFFKETLKIYSMDSVKCCKNTEENDETSKTTDNDPFSKCELRNENPWDESILKYINVSFDPKSHCQKNFSQITRLIRKRIITLNEKDTCVARCLYGDTEFKNKEGPWRQIFGKHAVFNDCDIVESRCYNNNGKANYGWVHHQIVKNTELTRKIKVLGKQYDVFVILLDSVSATQAQRVLPLSLSFLKENFNAVEFKHLNRVGLNSRPNAYALFYGKIIETIEKFIFGMENIPTEISKNVFCKGYIDDNHTSIFDEFRDYGYKTMLAEDLAKGVLNYPDCLGFRNQPTTHYMRPFQIALKYAGRVLKNSREQGCVGQHVEILNYLKKFMKAYREDPKFAWIWLTKLAHNNINEIYAADKDFFEFLAENRNQLNNSFLFLMGDHGLRFGQSLRSKLGKKEVNNPLLIASIPHELRRYDIYSQMQENSLELQTQFDLRATLMDILKHQPNEGFISSQYRRDVKERGSSFLREQPKPRTCKTLPISFAYCPCDFPKENLETGSDFALEMGKSAIEVIKNRLIKANVYHMCQPIELDRVLELYVYTPETVTKTYSLVVKTKKIDQEFSLTVRNFNNTWQFSTSIDRINQYGAHGDCVIYGLAKFCYCKKEFRRESTSLKPE